MLSDELKITNYFIGIALILFALKSTLFWGVILISIIWLATAIIKRKERKEKKK